MDAIFGGLDSRLRMPVKAADSIMVGLVNAAMEDAYAKSLWKDGDLERLFQKLRFAKLATMQLEWCLRFVRGEMESDDGHEQLLDDLLETRDRIQAGRARRRREGPRLHAPEARGARPPVAPRGDVRGR